MLCFYGFPREWRIDSINRSLALICCSFVLQFFFWALCVLICHHHGSLDLSATYKSNSCEGSKQTSTPLILWLLFQFFLILFKLMTHMHALDFHSLFTSCLCSKKKRRKIKQNEIFMYTSHSLIFKGAWKKIDQTQAL